MPIVNTTSVSLENRKVETIMNNLRKAERKEKWMLFRPTVGLFAITLLIALLLVIFVGSAPEPAGEIISTNIV